MMEEYGRLLAFKANMWENMYLMAQSDALTYQADADHWQSNRLLMEADAQVDADMYQSEAMITMICT